MIYFILGSPCNNYQGYCDVFKRCRGVDAEGPLSRLNKTLLGVDEEEPLSRLEKTLLSNETLTDTGDWIKVSEQFFILKK